MVKKKNCWEMKRCGREQGGVRAIELGPCPASTDSTCDRLNGGKNGGRLCWAITGTLCGDRARGTFAQKRLSCVSCVVFAAVRTEEGEKFVLLKPGQAYKPKEG